jgi:transcriptional activator SPT7
MLKKVKQKAYKSKREFWDDLELVWSNCYNYNAAEDHPLRGCIDQLRAKAEKLLRYITDQKERTDPTTDTTTTTEQGARSLK